MQAQPGANPADFYTKEFHVDPNLPMSEDCLYLNVWTPAKTAEERLPVMFWIYGGALQSGYTAEMEFNGERLARRGVIVVSAAYRTNVFGFLTHPEIIEEAKQENGAYANFGLLDQRAAISWVKENIHAFGGDADNITLFGQSAGAGSIQCHLTALENLGLFHKAIVQSGGGMFNLGNAMFPKLEEAAALGEDFFAHAGAKNLSEARAIDGEALLQAYLSYRGGFFSFAEDGQYVKGTPSKLFKENSRLPVRLIIGNTGNEFPIDPHAHSKEEFEAFSVRIFGEKAPVYMSLCGYPDATLEELNRRGRYISFQVGNMLWAQTNAQHRREPMYYYRFNPTYPGDKAGAFHSSELWFMFESLANCWRPFTGKHYDLARIMCNYWANFAKTGDPNGFDADGSPMPFWAPVDEKAYALLLGDEIRMDAEGPSTLEEFLINFYNERLDKDIDVPLTLDLEL
jgi:para-nitrobenzyl esterase